MKTSDFDYRLPPERIAQEPLPDRALARMMVVHRSTGQLVHARAIDLPGYLRAGDLLVVNDTRVFPARVFGERADTGGRVELLMLEEISPGEWEALYRASGRPRVGLRLHLAAGQLDAEIVAVDGGGRIRVRLPADRAILAILDREGVVPLPPYIRRGRGDAVTGRRDRERYQTVYARHTGAVAAPTAGLHLTEAVFSALEKAGIGRTAVTLHVGPGTFRPVKTDTLDDHEMEAERYCVEAGAADAIERARAAGGRIVAVGSTTVRTLETAVSEDGHVRACAGRTSLFIRPPYEFRAVDAMLTNFHLPMSTLIMMVAALARPPGGSWEEGVALVRRVYEEAVRLEYRFYSYGDCMLLL